MPILLALLFLLNVKHAPDLPPEVVKSTEKWFAKLYQVIGLSVGGGLLLCFLLHFI